jgi:putative oxidoreductase
MKPALALARVLLGTLLIVAGALKIGHAASLASSIAGFRLFPPAVVAPVAVILPFFEVLVGLYLVAGLFTRIAAWTAAAMFAAYAAAIASAVLRHLPANCGCFGPNDSSTADWPHVAFDLALALVAFFVAKGAPGAFALDGRINRR